MNGSTFTMALCGFLAFAGVSQPDGAPGPCLCVKATPASAKAKCHPKSNNEILFFEATWCRPCKVMAPRLQRLESGGVQVRRVNVDEDRSLTEKYRINSIPTLIRLVDGREAERLTGVASFEQINALTRPQKLNGEFAQEMGAAPNCPGGIPAAMEVETLLRATYVVSPEKADALMKLLKQASAVPMDLELKEDRLTITTTPAAQRTIGAFIHAFLRDAPTSPPPACSL